MGSFVGRFRAIAVFVMLPLTSTGAAAQPNTAVSPLAVYRDNMPTGFPVVQADSTTVPVLPGKKTFLTAYVEYNTSTCAEISKGSWAWSDPQFGTVSQGDVSGQLGNGACPGMTFTFRAIYYTLSKTATATSDSFTGTWTSPDYTVPITFNLVLPSITIVSQDITQDSIVVDPEPSGISGTLTISAIGDKAKPMVVNQTVSGGAQVTVKYGETTTPLPPSHYSKLKAQWKFPDGNVEGMFDVNFTALGLYQNTQYNRPHESTCSGAATPVTLWNSACKSKAGSFLSGFVSQTDLNGTGVPLIGGFAHTEAYCASSSTDFRHPYNNLGSCNKNTGALNNATLAVNFGTSAHFQCDDNVFFVGENPSGNQIGMSKTVTDTCPACGASTDGAAGHVDNFTTVPDCTGVPSLPDYQAIVIGR